MLPMGCNCSVYLYTRGGEPLYVGHTCRSVLVRDREHRRDRFHYLADNLLFTCADERQTARDLEQALICAFDPPFNKLGKAKCELLERLPKLTSDLKGGHSERGSRQ